MSGIASNAYRSDDRLYRYLLWRIWDIDRPAQLWIMLNPSTASETDDDPTIRKCKEFSRRAGYGGISIANLFAFRATSPKDLFKANNPIGPVNQQFLTQALLAARNVPAIKVIAAWGAHGRDTSMESYVRCQAAALGMPLYALRVTKDGAPGHPLYIPYTAQPQQWVI